MFEGIFDWGSFFVFFLVYGFVGFVFFFVGWGGNFFNFGLYVSVNDDIMVMVFLDNSGSIGNVDVVIDIDFIFVLC